MNKIKHYMNKIKFVTEECPNIFGAIRGLDKLKVGKEYIKVYKDLSTDPMILKEIKVDGVDTILIFLQGIKRIIEYTTYASDCGVISYNTGWNPYNHLKEVGPYNEDEEEIKDKIINGLVSTRCIT